METIKCEICGIEIERTGGRHKYCSECKKEGKRRNDKKWIKKRKILRNNPLHKKILEKRDIQIKRDYIQYSEIFSKRLLNKIKQEVKE